MNIEKYISDLLFRYQCVTVPSFGAFLTEFKSAQISNENVIVPPKKVLIFNSHLKNNDGLLANHIALEENISYSEAIIFIKNEVNNWLLKLEEDKTIELKTIGTLNLNKERNIVFSPSEEINFDTNSFGLSEVVAPTIERTESFVEKTPEATPVAVEKQPEKTSIAKQLFEDENKATETKPKTKNKTARFFKVAALLAVAIGAVLFGFKAYNDKAVEENTLVIQKSVQDKVQQKVQEATFVMENPIPAAQVDVKVEEKATEIATSSENVINTKTENQAKVTNNNSLPYHIIAGSFKNEANATNKVKDLKAKGYTNANIVDKNSHGLLIVAYKSFSNIENARQELKTIQQNDNDQAWILTK